jgi:HK97 family phage portal protein
MGWFARREGATAVAEPTNAIALDESSELFKMFAQAYATSSGVAVNSDTAVASVAVLACLIVRAESLMVCSPDVFRRNGRNREAAPDHPVQALISDEWNPLLGAEEGWRWKQNTEDLRGAAYVRIEWARGKPVALWPMYGPRPVVHTAKDINDRATVVYRYAGDEFTKADDYPARDVLHFKGTLLSRSPYEARSLVEVTAENIGLGIASEQFFARFLGNGNHFPRYLQTDNTLNEKDVGVLRKQLDDGAGLLSAGVTRIFDRGLKVMSSEMSLRDADLTGQQRWILEQVCRTWRVPLPIVQDLTHGTYTNSEQADLWLSKHTTAPIARNSEGVIRRGLFLPSERRTHYAKFNLNAMQRGDFKTRTAGYSILIQCGVLSPNEARAFEDWNPYVGGDEFRVPLNTGPAGGEPDGDEAPANGWQSNDPKALAPLLADARQRILARHEQNTERGRDRADSVAFATVVLEPIAQTAGALGVPFDVEILADAMLDGAPA